MLVDEYDKPILDALEAPEVARANRDFLRGSTRSSRTATRTSGSAFLTGVSKFSKVSLFSGLNNLKDITLDPALLAVCGYTDADLDTVFAPELPGLDRDAGPRVVQRLQLARPREASTTRTTSCCCSTRREFKAHWFETGTPTFLVDTLFERRVSSLRR